VKYPNRIWFAEEKALTLRVDKLYASETDHLSTSFVRNRYVLATLIANKQVHATPLTADEGEYLEQCCAKLGEPLEANQPVVPEDLVPVFPNHVVKKPLSEAGAEVMILKQRLDGSLKDGMSSWSSEGACAYNQFVLGFQRICDILIQRDHEVVVIEIKKSNNTQNDPYEQLLEYGRYCFSSFRLTSKSSFQLRKLVLAAVLERRSPYLARSKMNAFRSEADVLASTLSINVASKVFAYHLGDRQLLESERID
jgi:hypothetical protein